MDHADGADLPERRTVRAVLAQVAGRVDPAFGLRDRAVAPDAAVGGNPRLVGEQDSDGLDETLRQVALEFRIFGEQNVAGRLDKNDIARGRDDVRTLVVDDPFGPEQAALLRDLDIADGDDDAESVVEHHLVGRDDRRLVGRLDLGPGRQRLTPTKAECGDCSDHRLRSIPRFSCWL